MGTPGGPENQKNGADDWSQLPKLDDMPTFGREERRTPLPPLPDANHPTHREEHAAWHADSKQADEEPVDWRNYVQSTNPGKSLKIRDVKPGGQPEAPNAHQGRIDPTMRSVYWGAYGQAAAQVDDLQNAIAPDYAAFMNGAEVPELKALGFLLGNGGDASTVADAQPLTDGTTLGSLFSKDGTLSLTKNDRAAMQTAQAGFKNHSSALNEHNATVSADYELYSRLHAFEEAKDKVITSKKGVDVANLEIEKVELTHRVGADKEKIEQAKEHAEKVQKAIEFVVGGVMKYTLAGPEEAIDAVEGLGAMASYAVSKISAHSIASAEKVLEEDTKELQTKETEAALAQLEKAKSEVKANLENLAAARGHLLAFLGERKNKYQTAGDASAHASGGDARSKAKISSMMAAIPVAEQLVGMLRNLSERCSDPRPQYSSDAGSGFAMALYDGNPKATNMVAALGDIAFLRSHFGQLLHQWGTRLQSLQQARTLLGGERAPVKDDDLTADITSNKPLKRAAPE